MSDELILNTLTKNGYKKYKLKNNFESIKELFIETSNVKEIELKIEILKNTLLPYKSYFTWFQLFISLVIIAIQIANCIVLSQKIGQKEYKLSKEYRDSSPFNIILPPSLQMKNQNIISLNVSSLKYYDKPFNDTMFFI